MLFNSFEFVAFLIIVLSGAAALRRWPAAERWFLVLASAWFYGQWSWKYLALIYLTITVDYLLGRAMRHPLKPGHALALSLTVNLSVLAFFKYANFLVENAVPLFTAVGLGDLIDPVEVLLPVGISFYTFQSMSYTIDRYRGHMPRRQSFRDYALFVSFFPQLVAGPIVRASEFFQQLDHERRIDFAAFQTGMILITVGLVKKVVFADNLAVVADPVFDNPAAATGLQTLLGIYAFAFQIYFDFSGYSDIAIGAARLLGFRFPKNFDHPYSALSIRDFWRRWHMTLSRWLRDYLYISLGGSRGSELATARNLMLTMLLGGLWHGASWNFVFWGGLHGSYLAMERYWLERFDWWRDPRSLPNRALRWLLCFHLVCFAWIFFRAPDFSASMQMIANLGQVGLDTGPIQDPTVALIVLLPLAHWLSCRYHWVERLKSATTAPYVAVQSALVLTLALWAPWVLRVHLLSVLTMGAFLRHPKFWLPLLIVILLETAFRLGAWEPLARPDSYAGTSVATQSAVAAVGPEQISGITLGDSRTVYGFDHAAILEALSRGSGQHLSLAMGGSHLATFRAVAEWSLNHMPNLQRIVVGVAPGSMTRVGNGSYEVAIVEPFRDASHYWQLVEHFPPEAGDLKSLGSISALMAYREDLVDYILDPRGRHKALRRAAQADPRPRLTFANRRQTDLCPYDLSSPAQCRAELARLTAAGSAAEPAARTFATYCKRTRNPAPAWQRGPALQRWLGWLSDLSRQVDVVLVLMPEHSLLSQPEDTRAVHEALAPVTAADRLKVVDLTAVYPDPQCRWFSDLVHANQAGAELATRDLLEKLGGE